MNNFKFPIMAAALVAAAASAHAEVAYEQVFNDSTLRVDYILAADSLKASINLAKMVATPGWHGRRHNLERLPLEGNGQITVTDKASGDTIYRHSFGTLFGEWYTSPEAIDNSLAFENSFLIPQPKNPAIVEIKLFDKGRNVLARQRSEYNPKEELVRRPKTDQPLPYRYLHKASDPAHAIDIAILAEGYTNDEIESFYEHAMQATQEMLSYEPYKRYADRFNFIAVASPSQDSGVSVPLENDWKRTAFNSHFSTMHSPRYLTSPNLFAMHDALIGIPYEHIIVLANTDTYGGGGILNSYMLSSTRNKYFLPVIVHEFGHSFGGLADEYFYENDGLMSENYLLELEPWEQNITTLVDFDSKWKDMLNQGTPVPTPVSNKDQYPVGVFEGGGYATKGIYRPADECRMRNNTYPTFCPVCERALERVILFYTE